MNEKTNDLTSEFDKINEKNNQLSDKQLNKINDLMEEIKKLRLDLINHDSNLITLNSENKENDFNYKSDAKRFKEKIEKIKNDNNIINEENHKLEEKYDELKDK